MPAIRVESLSAFGRLAVKLDEHFSELTRLSGQIERLDIDSESGLEHAVKVLNQFAEHGTSVAEGIQELAKVLDEARTRTETAARVVAGRAEVIQQRKQQQQQVRERLSEAETQVKAANANLTRLRQGARGEYTQQERLQLKTQLAGLNEDLKKLVVDVQAVKDTASQAKFRTIELDAKNLLEALRTACRKLDQAIG